MKQITDDLAHSWEHLIAHAVHYTVFVIILIILAYLILFVSEVIKRTISNIEPSNDEVKASNKEINTSQLLEPSKEDYPVLFPSNNNEGDEQ